MYYTVYKVTNIINGKFYIGKHQTENLDDEYFGSGKYLKRAIKKYGIENFKKEILEVYDTEAKMNLAEKILVVIDREVSYNICSGGQGGWGYINKYRLSLTEKHLASALKNIKLGRKKLSEKLITDINFKNNRSKNISDGLKLNIKNNGHWWIGRQHREETKLKMANSFKGKQEGNKNSQFGTYWITDGLQNKKHKDTFIPEGWYKGRITKK